MVPELYQRACTAAQSGDMALSVSLLRQFAETKADTMFHAFARSISVRHCWMVSESRLTGPPDSGNYWPEPKPVIPEQ